MAGGNENLDPWGKILIGTFENIRAGGGTAQTDLAPATGKDWLLHQVWLAQDDPVARACMGYMLDSQGMLGVQLMFLIPNSSPAQDVPLIWPNGVVGAVTRLDPDGALVIPGDISGGQVPGLRLRTEALAAGKKHYGEYIYQERDRS